MTKSTESTLFGVKHYNPTHNGMPALHWAQFRAPGAWGHMNDDDRVAIIWFRNIAARDDFISTFGGLRVTLQRKDEVVTGDKAMEFLRAANNNMRSVG